MPSKPRMRTRAEVEAALRFARNRHAAEHAAMVATLDPKPYRAARDLRATWAGRIDAYEYVLRLDPVSLIKADDVALCRRAMDMADAAKGVCPNCGHIPHPDHQCGAELPEGTCEGSHCSCGRRSAKGLDPAEAFARGRQILAGEDSK